MLDVDQGHRQPNSVSRAVQAARAACRFRSNRRANSSSASVMPRRIEPSSIRRARRRPAASPAGRCQHFAQFQPALAAHDHPGPPGIAGPIHRGKRADLPEPSDANQMMLIQNAPLGQSFSGDLCV